MTARQVCLGDVADLLVGFAFKSAQFLHPSDTGINLVRGDNVQQGVLRWGDRAMKWSSDAYDDFARYQLYLNDVLLAMDRPIVGGGLKLAWVKASDLPCLLVQRVTRIRGLSGVSDTNYLRFALSAPDFIAHIDRITTGANIPHISGKDISAFSFRLPPLDEQLTIVEKLLAYDDLIENNRRRIALLEESARLLYREWFVHLRFPGSDLVKWEDGVPSGWQRNALSALVEVNPKTPFEKDKPFPFVPMQALSETCMLISAPEVRPISGGAKFRNGDTLLARITPCLENGKTGFVQFLTEEAPVASGSTEFIVLRSKSVNPYWIYCLAREEGFRSHAISSMSGADGRQRVSTQCFDSFEVLQPPKSVLEDFAEHVEICFKQIQGLSQINHRLQEARDALLPKLMSGEIAV